MCTAREFEHASREMTDVKTLKPLFLHALEIPPYRLSPTTSAGLVSKMMSGAYKLHA